MAEKRTIRAKDIVTDIRAGMSDHELMGKYKLSVKGLESIFRKLEESGTMKRSELYSRFPSMEDTVNLGSMRKMPRNYFALVLRISEAGNRDNRGEVFDANEKGVGVTGIDTTMGRTLNLVIEGSGAVEIGEISFKATCRWTRLDDEGVRLTGFEIVEISDLDLVKLRKLIRNAAL